MNDHQKKQRSVFIALSLLKIERSICVYENGRILRRHRALLFSETI